MPPLSRLAPSAAWALPVAMVLIDGVAAQEELPLRPVDVLARWRSPRVDGLAPTTLRLVDALSGKPVPGAMAFVMEEATTPLRGEIWSAEWANADDLGFSTLWTKEETPRRIMVDAPGYSVHQAEDGFVVPMVPAVSIPFVVRNHLGEPAPGAKVGYCIGCGHTPDVRVALTDASGHGVLEGPLTGLETSLVRRGIRDIYLETSGLDLFYSELDRWLPGAPPIEIACEGAKDMFGRIVDRNGTPRSGVVAKQGPHRGPITFSGIDGRFRLVSPKRREGREIMLGAWGKPDISFLLPPITEVDLCMSPGPPAVAIRLRTRDKVTGKPIAGLGVHAIPRSAYRHSQVSGRTDADGQVELALPAGKAIVWFSDFVNEENRIVYASVQEHEIDIASRHADQRTQLFELPVVLDPQVQVHVTNYADILKDREHGWYGVFLSTARGRRAVELDEQGRGTASVPRAEPSALMTNTWRQYPLIRFDPGQLPQRPVEVRYPPAPVVRLRPVNAEGREIALDGFERKRDGVAVQRSGHLSNRLLRVTPKNRSLRPRTLLVPSPVEGDTAVDLGRITFSAWEDASLRLRLPEARDLSAAATVARPGVVDSCDFDEFDETQVRGLETGAWFGMPPLPGDWVLVDMQYTSDVGDGNPTHNLRHREQLEGNGPWQVEIPTGEIEVEIVDRWQQPIAEVDIFVRDQIFRVDGTLRLRHVPAVPLDFIFVHPDHGAGVGTVRLRDGEKRKLRVVLDH